MNEQTPKIEVDTNDPRLGHFISDGLSEYDLVHMTEIIKENYGNWYHAKLLRAFYELLRVADIRNEGKLMSIYPGTCAAIKAWYNGELPLRPLSK